MTDQLFLALEMSLYSVHYMQTEHTLARSGLLAYLAMLSFEMSMKGPSGSVSMEAVPSLTWRPEAVVTGL